MHECHTVPRIAHFLSLGMLLSADVCARGSVRVRVQVRLGLRRKDQKCVVTLTRNVPNTKNGFIPASQSQIAAPPAPRPGQPAPTARRAGIGIMLQPKPPDGKVKDNLDAHARACARRGPHAVALGN